MTLHSSGFFPSGRRQAASTIIGWPVSPSLPGEKTLAFGATIHSVRDSKKKALEMKLYGRWLAVMILLVGGRAVAFNGKIVTEGPGKEIKTKFQIATKEGACSALYPVHIYAVFRHNGQIHKTHAIQIFEMSNSRQKVIG